MPKKPAKETKTLTPAKKPAKAVRKTTVAATTVPAVKAVEPKPVLKPVQEKPIVTTVSASFDVGFGNTLFIRGEGPGLSWDKGVPLENLTADKWSIAFRAPAGPITFKFLINDEVWSGGEDYVVAPGSSSEFTPIFPNW